MLNSLYQAVLSYSILEITLQIGKVIYKMGDLLTKNAFHLQIYSSRLTNGKVALQFTSKK